MNNEEHYTEIDLTALLKALWRHIWLIAASVIVIGAMAFSYARFFVTPMYTASALMYVNNNSLSVGSTKVSLSARRPVRRQEPGEHLCGHPERADHDERGDSRGRCGLYLHGYAGDDLRRRRELHGGGADRCHHARPAGGGAGGQLRHQGAAGAYRRHHGRLLRPRGGHRRSPVHTLLPQLHQLYGAGACCWDWC